MDMVENLKMWTGQRRQKKKMILPNPLFLYSKDNDLNFKWLMWFAWFFKIMMMDK